LSFFQYKVMLSKRVVLMQDDAQGLERLTAEVKGWWAILRVGAGNHAASRNAHPRADPAVLTARQEACLQALGREELYCWVEATLWVQQYEKQPKAVRGL
jgi:hypothetical protein